MPVSSAVNDVLGSQGQKGLKMKKKLIKSIAVICAAALFAETFSGMGILTAKAAASDYPGQSNVFLDSGGYKTEPYGSMTNDWGQTYKNRADVLPKRENVYLTDNYTDLIATVPTSDWVSSVVFDKFSESLYVHPMAFRAVSAGMEMAVPAVVDVKHNTDHEPAVKSLLEDSTVELVMGGSGFAVEDARMDASTDWAYDISMKSADKSSEILTTLAKGSPYVYYRFKGVEPALSLGGGASNMAVYHNDLNSNWIGISVQSNTDNTTHYYGVYASDGASWRQADGRLLASLPSGKEWITIAALPDGEAATFNLYGKYAANRISDTRAEWSYDEAASKVTTVYNVTTTNMDSGESGADTIIALYPHQWRYAADVTYTGKTYETIRGVMKTMTGKSYTTEMTYNGILAAMPTPKSEEGLGTLKEQISYFWDYYQNTCNGTYSEAGDTQYGGYDTYWMGKNLNKRTDVVFMAEQIEDTGEEWSAIKNDVLEALRKDLEYWFNPADCYTVEKDPYITGYFYHYADFGTLIGYNSSYSTDSELNDHHFHYGYWIKAAAAVARYVDDWEKQWGAMVYEMISDIANPNRDGTNLNVQRTDVEINSSTKYPFMRNFDIYEGHSWASGVANYEFDEDGNMKDPAGGLAGGNNQESTSEAVNAWSSLILWGEAVGDKKIRDLGVYLYTTEVAAIEEYYFDVHDEVFTDAYEDRDNFNQHVVTRLFGGRYDHSAWWTEDPIEVTSIHMIPMTGAMLYLAKYPEKIKATYDSIWGTQWSNYLNLHSQNGWNTLTSRYTHHDLLAEFYALADPEAAMGKWSIGDVDGQTVIETGESRAHTYGFIQSMIEYGTPDFEVTGSTAMSMVFKDKNGNRTYVAQNFTDQEQNVYFSDGTFITVPAGSSYVGDKTGEGENPELKGKVSYILEMYLQNIDGSGYDMTSVNKKAEAGEFTLKPEQIKGFTFNSEAQNVLTATLTEGEDNQVTLKVYYTRDKYPISYELNEGTNAGGNPAQYVYGTTVSLEEPVRAGYRFMGWFLDAGFSRPFSGITETDAGEVTVYAKWMSETSASYITRVFMQNPGLRSYTKVSEEILTGETGTEASFEYAGNTEGFILNEDKSVRTGNIQADGSLVLCLYYDRQTYPVTYQLDGGENAYGNVQSYVYGVGMTLAAPYKEGYTFGGWYTDEACTEGNQITEISETDMGEKTFFAKWIQTPEASGTAGDTNLPEGDFSFTYDPQKKHVTISVKRSDAANVICYIAKYEDGDSAKKACQDANNALPGISLPGHLGIMLTKDEEGFSKEIVEITLEEGQYIVFGLNINGIINADSAYYYAKMGGDSTTSYTVNYYKQNLALDSYKLAEQKVITGAEAGSVVEAETVSYEGFTFNGDNSIVSGEVKADGGLTLSLYYDRNLYQISYENMEDAMNCEENDTKYVYGEGIILGSPSKDGYIFEGWYTNPDFAEDSKISQIGDAQTGDVTVYAKWAEDPSLATAAYTVKYYKQKTTLDGYEEAAEDRITGKGRVDGIVKAKINDYKGFTHNPDAEGSVCQGIVSEDGSLELRVYYDRNKYRISYHNMQHAQNVEANKPEYVYGVGLTLSDPVKDKFVFKGWYTDAACTAGKEITEIGADSTGDVDVYAKWAPAIEGQIACIVKYYVQNTQLDGYEELAEQREEILANKGDTVQAEVKVLHGFHHNPEAEGTLLTAEAAEGLELAVYYDRNHYKISYYNVTDQENPSDNKTEYVYGAGFRLKEPHKEGFYFDGWYTGESCEPDDRIEEISSTQAGDILLYAKWVPETYAAEYSVEYYLQDISGEGYSKAVDDSRTAYATIGSKVTAPDKKYRGFTKNRHVEGSLESGTVTEDGSLVLKVYYDRNVYKVTYCNIEDAQMAEENKAQYVYGQGFTLGMAFREGYKFKGWYTDQELTENSKITYVSGTGTGDITVYAKWIPVNAQYQVKYYLQNKTLDDYEEKTADVQNIIAETGETVKADIIQYPGYECNKALSVLQGTVEADGSLVLKVYYNRKKYAITYHNMDGAVNPDGNPAEYVYGIGVKFEEPSKEDYVFGGWYTDAAFAEENKIAEISTVHIGEMEVYAKWIEEGMAASYRAEYYFQNTALDGYERAEEEDFKGSGIIGESVSAPDKEFEGFTKNPGAEEYKESGIVAEDGSLLLKVYYDRNRYDIIYHNMEDAKNPVANSPQYTYGITLTLKEPSRKGYVFGGWYSDAELSAAKKVTQIEAGRTGTAELYAKWTDKSELLWTVEAIADHTYTGKKITPVVVVKDKESGRKLQLKKDYTVKYQNNLNAGTATVIITGKGNYTGARNITFHILPVDLNEDTTVSAGDIYKFVTGKPVKISPVIKWGKKKLKLNKDFRIDTSKEGSASAYTEEGIYDVALTGMGNYKGTLRIKAVLTDKKTVLISKAKVSGVVNVEYRGEQEYTQNLKVVYKGTELTEGTHYKLEYRNNTQAGTAEIIIKGLTGDSAMKFTGIKTVKFKITGEKLKANNISFDQVSYTYSGAEITPAVIVKNASGEIIPEEQYTVEYSGNVDKGKGTVLITGINGYEGSVKKTFTIAPLDIADSRVQISTEKSVPFTKGGAAAKVVVTYNGEILSEDTDYILKYSGNQKTGEGKVLVTGKGNFTGNSEQGYTIVKKDLSEVSVIAPDITYNGKKNMQYYLTRPVLMDVSGKNLSAGKDYRKEFTYELRMEDGSYKTVDAQSDVSQVGPESVFRITIEGMGDYDGRQSVLYRVIESDKSIKNARISIAPQTYTGRPVSLTEDDIISVEIKCSGSYMTLEPDQYEIVPGSYKNNTKKGTAKVMIRGIGEYGGYKEAAFKIEAQNIEKTTIISRILKWLGL